MKKNTRKFLLIIFLCAASRYVVSAQSNNDSNSFINLVKRIAPQHAGKFTSEIISAEKGEDVFELDYKNGKIILRGNNDNSLAVALNHYLKYYCYVTVSWYVNDPVKMPSVLPPVLQVIRQKARVKNRFFLNYCTFGYTMPWWQWKDWERFIDWMALNGINMPLAITGQEAIWYKVWEKLGLTDKQIREYFTGPAHLPWNRMSNIDKLQGPLPQSYINDQLILQKKIVKRERELGMKPVLTAFSGHVPGELQNKFPQAKITQFNWGEFPKKYRSHFLDPLDTLFKKIQALYLQEQTKEFGTDHFYGADPFNELKPPSLEPEYLKNVSKTIYESIAAEDSAATWLMMAWVFYFERDNWSNERIKAFLSGVPPNKIMLLDYYCERSEVWKMTEAFFGSPYLWCYLGNFGGNTMLAGNIDTVGNRIENAFQNGGSNLSGIGSTLEGFDANPLMYEYILEKAWINSSNDSKTWINQWADRRYGSVNADSRAAWKIIGEKIYAYSCMLGQATLTNARPSLTGSGNWTTNPQIDYSNKDLLQAWELLLKKRGSRKDYDYDLVNVGRQVLGNFFHTVRDSFALAYQNQNKTNLNLYGARMLQLLDDMDRLLGTNQAFLLGKWLNDARSMGRNNNEKAYFENNARTIITIWGEKAHSLNDYANRCWSGLVKSYYKERWKMFINDVTISVKKNVPFNEKAFHSKITQFEWNWTKRNNTFSSVEKGNAFNISKELLKKYGPMIKYQ